ncbi:MAG: hypothetical protein ACOCQY_00345 [Halorhabdus sp.]
MASPGHVDPFDGACWEFLAGAVAWFSLAVVDLCAETPRNHPAPLASTRTKARSSSRAWIALRTHTSPGSWLVAREAEEDGDEHSGW